MSGLKFKIAHKRADSDKWSATPKAQRKRMIKFLRDVIADLEKEPTVDTAADEKSARPASPKRRFTAPPSMMKPVRRRRKARSATR